MANIINNNFQNVKLKCDKEDYWDFFLNQDDYSIYSFSRNIFHDDSLISYIDLSSKKCINGNEIKSINDYVWMDSYSDNSILYNIGYTGFDNGLIQFHRDRIVNKEFIELYKNSKYNVGDDNCLKLHSVSGCTKLYEYPITLEQNCIKLNGGFYQGFFKTKCGQYEVLPSKLDNGETWSYEFVLKKSEFEKESNKTLNDKYKDNKGIFFYIGTRAENKWSYLYNKKEDECFSLDIGDYVEDVNLDVKTFKINSFIDVEDVKIDCFCSNSNNKNLNDKPLYEENILDIYYSRYKDAVKKYEDLITSNPMGFCCGFNMSGNNDFNDLVQSYKKMMNDILSEKYRIQKYLEQLKSNDINYNNIDDCDSNEDSIYIENDIDISNYDFFTENGLKIGKKQYSFETDNKFLLFDRTKNGYDINNWSEGSKIMYIGDEFSFNENLFLLMNRTDTGYTVNDIEIIKYNLSKEYDILSDLYNNALAFRIKDDGSIGYRYLILDCESDEKYTIKEAYSKPNLIVNDEWCVIHVKIRAFFNKMKLFFYVNGNLVFISDELPLIDLRKLNDTDEKQETVPYNISIGGGSQGLIETILPNYMIDPYRIYPIEKYFAGTFIGYLKSFKMYNSDIEYSNILNNFKYEMNNLKNN